MKNNIKNQLGELLTQLHPQLSPQQRNTLGNAMILLNDLPDLIDELQMADQIIQNCINSMNDDQRLQVAKQNQRAALSLNNGWAFRTEKRQQTIARAKRMLGGA